MRPRARSFLVAALGFAGLKHSPLCCDQPIAALPLQVFAYAISPFDDWHRQAWAGALVLIGMVFLVSLAARVATRGRFSGVR